MVLQSSTKQHRQPHSESYSETKSINTHLKEKHVSILVLGSSRLVVTQAEVKATNDFLPVVVCFVRI